MVSLSWSFLSDLLSDWESRIIFKKGVRASKKDGVGWG